MALFEQIDRAYNPFDPAAPNTPPRSLWPFMRWALWEMRWVLAGLIAASLLLGFAEAGVLYGVGLLVDAVETAQPGGFFSDNLTLLLFLLALVAVVRPGAVLIQAALTSLVVIPGLTAAVTWRLHRYSLRQSAQFFDDDFAGRLAQKQMQAGQAVMSATVDVINTAGLLIAFLIGMTLALGAADWRLGALVVLWTAAYVAWLWLTLPEIRARSKRRADRRAVVTGRLVDSFANIKTVMLYARADAETADAEEAIGRYRDSSVHVGRATYRLRVGLMVLNVVLIAGVAGFALALWNAGTTSVGVVAAAASLSLRVAAMSNWIAFTALSVFNEVGTLEDAIESLAKPHAITDPETPAAKAVAGAPAIEFDQVGFRYGRGVGGVRSVSLTVPRGRKVGLVGRSGAGKSTLVNLLMRLHDVEDGAVRVDGVDVRAFAQDDLRRRIGVITQENAVFNRSVLHNIRYGRPGASDAEVIAAARRAEAHAFIADLRDAKGRVGYDAHLGERGVKLSGGQRQRIALARVMLKDAPILVLDEATSALDSEVEAAILESLSDVMAGKTVIAIAHRLSTIAQMDEIVVLDDGCVVEQGDHEGLISRGGVYAQLWARQSGGFLGVEPTVAPTPDPAAA